MPADRSIRAWPAVITLARREVLRFLRQPARIAAAVGTALLLWIVVGGGFAHSINPASGSYSSYLIPGLMTLVAMFAAIFSNISIIEDRREGFLQGVLVSPAPRAALAGGLIGGGAIVAWVQAMALLPLAAIAGTGSGAGLSVASLLPVAAALLLTSIALQSLGLIFAWRCRDAASFHAVMNLVLMPLWLLSDALFPAGGASPWLGTVIALNPLSWCASAVRQALGTPLGDGVTITVGWPMLGTAAFAVIAFLGAVAATRSRSAS